MTTNYLSSDIIVVVVTQRHSRELQAKKEETKRLRKKARKKNSTNRTSECRPVSLLSSVKSAIQGLLVSFAGRNCRNQIKHSSKQSKQIGLLCDQN